MNISKYIIMFSMMSFIMIIPVSASYFNTTNNILINLDNDAYITITAPQYFMNITDPVFKIYNSTDNPPSTLEIWFNGNFYRWTSTTNITLDLSNISVIPEPTPTPKVTPETTPEITPTPDPTIITIPTGSDGGSSSNSGSSSSGGGGGSPSEPYNNLNKSYKVEKQIYRDTLTIYDFSKAGMSIYEIDINSNINIPETEIKIEELKNISKLTEATIIESSLYYNIWINTIRYKNSTIVFDCSNYKSVSKWNTSTKLWESLYIKDLQDNICKITTNTLSTTFAFTKKIDTYENTLPDTSSNQVKKQTITKIQPQVTDTGYTYRKDTVFGSVINWILTLFGVNK